MEPQVESSDPEGEGDPHLQPHAVESEAAEPKWFDIRDYIDQPLPSLLVSCRHAAIAVTVLGVFMFVTDLSPLVFGNTLSFEYFCFFYPAGLSFLYGLSGCVLYFWRSYQVRDRGIPIHRVLGILAVLASFIQVVFNVVGMPITDINSSLLLIFSSITILRLKLPH